MINKFISVFVAAFLPVMTGCGPSTDASTTTNTDAALVSSTAAVHQSQAKLSEIDGAMAALQRHHAEDPAKMNRLIAECQSETGVAMQGEGAMKITNCVNSKW